MGVFEVDAAALARTIVGKTIDTATAGTPRKRVRGVGA
jgi:hypothetical protein